MQDKPRPVVDLTARCTCGRVAVRLNGKVRAMFLCSCEDCQRDSGGGHSCVVLVRASEVTVDGPTKSYARPANSGAEFTRHFCPECGTPVLGHSSRAPDLRMLPVGLFGAQADWYMPTQLVFARSHRDWDTLPEGLPMYATYREEGSIA